MEETAAPTVWEQLSDVQRVALGQKDAAEDALKQTIQQRVEAKAAEGFPAVWWFSRPTEWEIAPWWSQQRDLDLRAFVKKEGNDILAGAVSSMVKKFKAMNWLVDGPQATVEWAQDLLSNAEFGKGWGTLLGKVIEDYLQTDKGAFIEVIGPGDPDKALDGLPTGIAHLDSIRCTLTGDPTYPVIFHNAKGGRAHKLHATRVIHLVDMESPNEDMLGTGFCACSRVVASSQLLMMLSTYKREKLDDLPQAGILVLNNVVSKQWDDTVANYERERRKLGQEIWANVMTLFGVDPAQPASADFVNFSQIPDHFNEQETITNYVNIVALAFGLDAREFWPVSSGALGTAAESLVMHQKAKGKGIGELISAIERAINWKVFPKRVTFEFDFTDDEEDAMAADIKDKKVTTIMKMFVPDADGMTMVATRDEVRQMLADADAYFDPDFLLVDMDTDVEATDTEQEAEKAWGPLVVMDKHGEVRFKNGYRKKALKQAEPVQPEGEPLEPFRGQIVEITPEDVAAAILGWDERVPEAAGLLNG